MAKSNEGKLKKRREQKRLSMKRARERLKQDQDKHEEVKRKDRERYKKKKEAGKIKSIKELNRRDQKILRKEWVERAKRFRQRKKENKSLKQILEYDSPPPTPESREIENYQQQTPSTSKESSSRSRIVAGKKVAKRNRYKWKREKEKLLQKLDRLEKRKNVYKSRYNRAKKELKKYKSTPEKNVEAVLVGQSVRPEIKRQLLFGEVIKKQIKENFCKQKSPKDRQKMFSTVLHGSIVRKYKFQNHLASLTSRRTNIRYKVFNHKFQTKCIHAKNMVIKFLEQDENSRLTSGKKETKTRKKVKKQVRFLNDSLRNLHKKFIENSNLKRLSYATFCKLRPFWILLPKVNDRQTCLCKTHANISLLITKLKTEKIINENSPRQLIKAICCADQTEACLERKCKLCKSTVIPANVFNELELTSYEKWATKKVSVIIKGQEKICSKTVKETITCSKGELLNELKTTINYVMQHENNVTHQYKAIREIKQQLSENEAILHMDFSENYCCKYGEEIQSAHFGGSKPQITLHTVVLYYASGHKCFCTLSESLRHDPEAICAHLNPIINATKEIVPSLNTIYFISDGPSTQYKNKKMFQLTVRYLVPELNVNTMYWNFTASGHGKGAPDGVGGCVKRTADTLVAQGKDINNYQKLLKALVENCKNITIFGIANDYSDIGEKLKNVNLVPFKGTTAVHQLSWSKTNESGLEARRLSCFVCDPGQRCKHYGIGTITVQPQKGILLTYFFIMLIRHSYVKIVLNYFLAYLMEQSKKLQVCDVYSSSDEDTVNENRSVQQEIKISDYVVARVLGLKSEKNYVGLVLDQKENDYQLQFLKKSGKKFLFPEKDDIAFVKFSYISKILSQPTVNNRQHYFFKSSEIANVPNLF